MFSNKILPKHYKCWREFRDFLVENISNDEIKNRFVKRFSGQPDNEKTYQKQVGQLLVLDYENAKSIDLRSHEKSLEVKKKWMELL